MTLLHYECRAAADLPTRAARAAIGQRVRSPLVLVPIAVLAVLAVVFATNGVGWLAVVIAVGVVVLVGSIPFRIPRLAAQLAARGMRPGATIAVDYDDSAFTVTTSQGSGVHAYADVRNVRVSDGIVAIRLARAGFVVLLPEELVPGEARRRLAV